MQGSIRTAALLQILVHAGYHVAYQPTASRDRKYTVHSRTAGVYVLDPRPAAQWNLVGEHGQCMYDAIIIARRYVFAAAIPVVQAQCPGVPIIYDTVDLHFLRESRDTLTQQEKKVVQSKEILHWLSSSSAPKDLVARRDEELSYVDASAVTLVVSPVGGLSRWMRGFGSALLTGRVRAAAGHLPSAARSAIHGWGVGMSLHRAPKQVLVHGVGWIGMQAM